MLGAAPAARDLTSTRRNRKKGIHHDRAAGVAAELAVPILVEPEADVAPAPPAEEVLTRERSEVVCRALNVSVAVVALVCLVPVMLLIALAVKLTSRGPVFYPQTRVGVDRRSRGHTSFNRRGYDAGGKPFVMYKFRTMRVDAEADGRAVWASRQDPRVTVIGRILRRTRLDELPQLYNVVRET